MDAAAVLAALRGRGLWCEVVERRLFLLPKHLVTEADRALLRAHRAAVLDLLGAGVARRQPDVEVEEPVNDTTIACPECGRLLPAARAQDPDFTKCLLCKITAIEQRRRRTEGTR